jgi:hypothetical protein
MMKSTTGAATSPTEERRINGRRRRILDRQTVKLVSVSHQQMTRQ